MIEHTGVRRALAAIRSETQQRGDASSRRDTGRLGGALDRDQLSGQGLTTASTTLNGTVVVPWAMINTAGAVGYEGYLGPVVYTPPTGS